MVRDAEQDLIAWNERKNRKPLILMGARQVGKTWLMNDFAAKHYPNRTVCVNLMKEDLIREAIESSDIDPQSIIGIIELKKRVTIVPGETLLILDETKKSSGDKWSELKAEYEKKYEDLRAKLKAKLEEYKAREAQKSEEARKKAEERKAKFEQTKKDSKDLIDSFKNLFD